MSWQMDIDDNHVVTLKYQASENPTVDEVNTALRQLVVGLAEAMANL